MTVYDLPNLTAEQIRFISEHSKPLVCLESEGSEEFMRDPKAYLSTGKLDDQSYFQTRAGGVRGFCSDGLVSCIDSKSDKRGILLIRRRGDPAKNFLWPIGGGGPRGLVDPEAALQEIANRECGLKLSDYVLLGSISVGWATSPTPEELRGKIQGGKGIRDEGRLYYAHGEGEIRLNKNLDDYGMIVTPEMWRKGDPEIQDLRTLHPYVSGGLHKAITLLEASR